MPSRNVILAAHLIKFGLPYGFLLAASSLIFSAFFKDAGVSPELIGQSLLILGLSSIWALVLGLSRSNG